MTARNPFRLPLWRGIFYLLLAIGLPLVALRYTRGLASVTNLSDGFPWGLWIGFDILVGVGLAAGGFVIAATVHVFRMERYEPIARPAVLTAFLGYVLVIVALLFDLGQPYRIWHPLVMWNPHSVMFEVAWCVMLYTTVLTLEFSPIVFERFGLHRAQRAVKAAVVPLVGLGFLLSTFLFIAAFMYIGGYRKHLAVWSISLGVTLLAALVFIRFAYVSLPRGVPPFDAITDFVRMMLGG